MLALLQPEKFGLPCPSVAARWPSERKAWLLKDHCQISPAPQYSSKGPNNRRTNFIEGHLNYFCTTQQWPIKTDLERAWRLFEQALALQPKRLPSEHEEQVKMAFDIEEPFHMSCLTRTSPGSTWMKDKVEQLFVNLAPLLQEHCAKGGKKSDLTYRLLADWVSDERFSTAGNISQTLRLLYKRVCRECDERPQNSLQGHRSTLTIPSRLDVHVLAWLCPEIIIAGTTRDAR